ncbi:hypothetical protein QLQ12_29705 [Actinoplanes sp. NEAU-A12]|uniref:Uncharacterized protein n=1 Tax=Actinoplanes sandaracinus TaxID=3045177 RepID=A0ABT6WSU8_9ACTN|nr:hypothetical protein [Actinoplanes sandaracinus]MDI6102804.1 hypothetical protein [Actinoplanes sandaracinus]
MAENVSAPPHLRALPVVAPALLIVYLMAVAALGVVVAVGRVELELITVAYLPLPAIAFAVPVWTDHRRRRATDAKVRHELLRRVLAELVISLVLLGSSLYQVATAPQAYFTILYA